LVKFFDNDFELDIHVDNDTVWLIQDGMALLFDMDRIRIVRHINSILDMISLLAIESNPQEVSGCRNAVKPSMKFNNSSDVFGIEKE
jgi:hypothetical protein